jgi:hypothetical protein
VIIFELICSAQHRFEGWFASGEDFDQQRLAGLLSCPICSTGEVAKLPTAKLRRAEAAAAENGPADAPNQQSNQPTPPRRGAAVAAFIDHVLQNTENVGRAFPEEARKIHHGVKPRRGIRGTATREETKELLEEGIPVLPLPIPPPDEVH